MTYSSRLPTSRFCLPGTVVVLAMLGCAPDSEEMYADDPHSFANPHEVVVTHMELDVDVDFDARKLRGRASFSIDNHSGTSQLVLDTRDLVISRVTLGMEDRETAYELGPVVDRKDLGRSLTIAVDSDSRLVNVYYETSPAAAAVQWLSPEQTSGRRHPFLFTQSQPTMARTWFPCQDTPGVRMTYSATIRVPPPLMAVMSAENPTKRSADGIYSFRMPQRIPSYLVALAVGDIDFRPTGPRTGVYAEPDVVDAAAWEFAETPKMMEAAERLYGAYRWERYDLIVLPPSFPVGGMENPRLTFATPTIMAGDRSLVSVVAHELAHSWSGNLVTAGTWNDFWLNEGFTTYFEHRIMEEVYGIDYDDMLLELDYDKLTRDVQEIGPDDPGTALYVDLSDRDPDTVRTVAYEKGLYFLRTAEHVVGRDRWDAFLLKYFDENAFQSMTTDRFVSYLRRELVRGDDAIESGLRIDEWVYGPGIPDNVSTVKSTQLRRADSQRVAFLNGTPAADIDTTAWTAQHWLRFLRRLPPALEHRQMRDLDDAFNLTDSHNSEILSAWLQRVAASEYEPAYSALEDFLIRQGRLKFLSPLYQILARSPEGLEIGRAIYVRARPGYHSISQGVIDRILAVG